MTSNDQMLTAALDLAARGWPVFPCKTRGKDAKRPFTAHGFKDASTDPGTIRNWWSRWPGAAIGVPTGQGIGCFVLDVDLPQGPDSLKALEAKHGPLPATSTQKTGSGGFQYFFRWPQGVEIRNSTGKLGPGLDVRGQGGYVLVPPSLHPSGDRYAWSSNGMPPANVPQWLLDLITRSAPEQKQEPAAKTKPATGQGTTAYGRKALEGEAEKVASAEFKTRNNTLYLAACKIGHRVAGNEIDEQDAWRALLDAAARCGLTEKEARKTITSGLEKGKLEPRSAPPRKDQSAPTQEQGNPSSDKNHSSLSLADATPIPFDDYSDDYQAPRIPPEIIPGTMGEFAAAVAESIQVPFELALCNVLGAAAVAAQGKIVARINQEYSEPLSLYLLCPLPPGERKSATVEACKHPIEEWDRHHRLVIAEDVKKNTSERKTLEKAVDHKRSEAAKAKSDQDRRRIMDEIARLEADMPEVLTAPQLLASDCTPEALAELMEQNGNRMGVIEDEGGLFDIIAGRYSNGVPNLDIYLKGHSNTGTVRVNRRGRAPIFIDNPCLSMALSVQPEVVNGLAAKPGFRGRGLLGRFIYFMPESMLGFREPPGKPPQIPSAVAAYYSRFINSLLGIPMQKTLAESNAPWVLDLSPEAKSLWLDFWREAESELRPSGRFEKMKDWGGKFPGHAIRIAGLFHLSTYAEPFNYPIDAENMSNAIKLGWLLAEHAQAAFGFMGSSPGMEAAKAILAWIQKEKVQTFTGRDALRKVRGKFPTMEQVNPGLSILEERAFIFQVEQERKGPGRKPSIYVADKTLFEGKR